MKRTETCPNCSGNAADAIDLVDADAKLEGLRECGCGAVFTAKAAWDGHASGYRKPGLGFDLFRAPGDARYVSVPGASLF
jgi:hypothetical protein